MSAQGELRSLTVEDAEALERFLSEFDAHPSELGGYFCRRDEQIEEVVRLIDGWEKEELLPAGWVPRSTRFWALEGQLGGDINVRHHLTPHLEEVGGHIGYSVAPSQRCKGVATAMLAGVLAHCRALGLTRALLTCNAENIASWKVIERCGGLLEREGWSEKEQRAQRWYWITL